jgi:large subunit ribosomal protein L21
MRYAIIQMSGKQILLQPGQWYDIDFIKNAKIGDSIFFNKILLLRKNTQIQIGTPFLENVKILAKVIQQIKSKKITVLKTKPKKNYTRKRGHRQMYTRIQIEKIN